MEEKLIKIKGLYDEIISLMKMGVERERVVLLLREVTKAEVELYNEMYGVLNIVRTAGARLSVMKKFFKRKGG